MHVGYKIMPTTIHSKSQKMPSLAVDRYINTTGCLHRFIETQIHLSTKEHTILNRVNQIIAKQLCSRCTVQSITYDGYRLSTTWDMLLWIHSWYCMWYHYQYGAILQADGLANIQVTLPSRTGSCDQSYSTFYGFMTVWHTRVHLLSNSPSHNGYAFEQKVHEGTLAFMCLLTLEEGAHITYAHSTRMHGFIKTQYTRKARNRMLYSPAFNHVFVISELASVTSRRNNDILGNMTGATKVACQKRTVISATMLLAMAWKDVLWSADSRRWTDLFGFTGTTGTCRKKIIHKYRECRANM